MRISDINYKRIVFVFPRYCLRVHRRVFMDFFTHHYCAYYKEAKKKTNSAKRFLKNSGENWLNLFSYSQYFEKSTYELSKPTFTCSMPTIKKTTTENLFKVNNKDTKTASLTSFLCLYC